MSSSESDHHTAVVVTFTSSQVGLMPFKSSQKRERYTQKRQPLSQLSLSQ